MENKANSEPRMLPIVLYEGVQYFTDLRLGQFRDIKNPFDRVDFDTTEGHRMCRHTGVVHCRRCGAGFIISRVLEDEHLICVLCSASIW